MRLVHYRSAVDRLGAQRPMAREVADVAGTRSWTTVIPWLVCPVSHNLRRGTTAGSRHLRPWSLLPLAGVEAEEGVDPEVVIVVVDLCVAVDADVVQQQQLSMGLIEIIMQNPIRL